MAATVYFLDPLPNVGDVAVLDGAEGRHAATVRRTTVGEQVSLTDGRGGRADVVVTAVARDRVEATVRARTTEDPPSPSVTLVQALPKSDRSELAVESATEAGIDAIVPWQSLRCVSRWEGPKAAKGVAKWRAAVAAAAKQSRRTYIPAVHELHDTKAVLALVADVVGRGGLALALHESARDPFASLPFRDCAEVIIVVGPEGGLDDAEVAALTTAGAVAVLLGPSVLRTSTAAAVALGALGVLTDRWNRSPHSV